MKTTLKNKIKWKKHNKVCKIVTKIKIKTE